MKGCKVTERFVRSILTRPPDGRTTLFWDKETRGFGVRVSGRGRATFVAQGRVRGGRLVRCTIGRCDRWTVEAARRRAREVLVEMDRGVDPVRDARAAREKGTTLAEALGMHEETARARGRQSGARYDAERFLADWLTRPLASISRDECARRHEKIGRERGPVAANRCFRWLRAVFNAAARRMDDPLANPVRAVTFNKERRVRSPVPWDALPAWRAKVEALKPVLRDFFLATLFTGLRASDAATIRWEHVDFEAGTVFRPKPKGGEDRAFTVPVARFVLDLLRRRREENAGADEGWAFPTSSIDGRVVPIVSRRARGVPSPHRCRDTFATACLECRVDPISRKTLLNHALPNGDVTDGYVRPSVEFLRGEVERVAAFLVARMAPAGGDGTIPRDARP